MPNYVLPQLPRADARLGWGDDESGREPREGNHECSGASEGGAAAYGRRGHSEGARCGRARGGAAPRGCEPRRLAGRVRRRAERAERVVAPRAVSRERVQQLDNALMTCARGMAQVRLELGAVLEHVATRGEDHRAGFSSLRAYALQVTGRSARWTSTTRTVARRLAALPKLRAALASGAITWSMAELVAQRVTPESDALLTELAVGSTVRQVRGDLPCAGTDVGVHRGRRERQRCRRAPGRPDVGELHAIGGGARARSRGGGRLHPDIDHESAGRLVAQLDSPLSSSICVPASRPWTRCSARCSRRRFRAFRTKTVWRSSRAWTARRPRRPSSRSGGACRRPGEKRASAAASPTSHRARRAST